MLALLLIRVLRLLNSSVQISFEFKHDAATKLVHGQGKARDVTVRFDQVGPDCQALPCMRRCS